ncbi:(3R)-3-[(carboxymethyl)amino]fatty acid oxygenase/decarboxylase-like isoform X2 [Babylonia areolata]|uniref:(3R)-3-[(carboxymethyl)amino]fatty acid oxygenase/decarboxylase-like isoform X2 n=1 Tax=Babylonia areolata TaxID=304850 RepID=UPI003FD10719
MTGWLNRVQVGLVNHPPPSLFQIFTATLNLVLNCSQSRDTSTVKKRMEYKPAPIGVEVCGIDLKQPVPDSVIAQIREDVHKHRMLIFKDQGVVSADRHVEISKWFGELESTFYKHPKSPHPDVFRVSNDEEEGCTNVGRTGWHIDGSFMEQPFSFALYHMVSVPKIGNTAFVPLKELLESMSAERREQWERLWRTDHHYRHIQPLVYPHPVTKQPVVLCGTMGLTKSDRLTGEKQRKFCRRCIGKLPRITIVLFIPTSGKWATSSFPTTWQLAMKPHQTHSATCLRWGCESCIAPQSEANLPP